MKYQLCTFFVSFSRVQNFPWVHFFLLSLSSPDSILLFCSLPIYVSRSIFSAAYFISRDIKIDWNNFVNPLKVNIKE